MTIQNRVITTQMNVVELWHQGQGHFCNDVISHFLFLVTVVKHV